MKIADEEFISQIKNIYTYILMRVVVVTEEEWWWWWLWVGGESNKLIKYSSD